MKSFDENIMSSPLAEILFKEYRRRLLGLLLLQPDSAYYVRKIARLTGTLAATLHKELSKLQGRAYWLKSLRVSKWVWNPNKNIGVPHLVVPV